MLLRQARVVLSLAGGIAIAITVSGCDTFDEAYLVVANDCASEIVVSVPGATSIEGVVVPPGRAWGALVDSPPIDPVRVWTADGKISQVVDTAQWKADTNELAIDVSREFCASTKSQLVAVPRSSKEIDERYYDRID